MKFLVSLVLLAGSTFAQTPNQADLQKLVTGVYTADQIPGAMLSVVPLSGTGAVTVTAGVANLQSNTPLNTSMTMRIGSNTKTFTATVILQLIGSNAIIPGTTSPLTLDTTATQVLGTQALANIPYANQITMRMLLSMTSGIYDYNDDAFQELIYDNPGAAWTPQQILNTLQGKQPLYPPNSSCSQCPNSCIRNTNCWNYSNTNYIILGMVIEKMTNDTAANQLQQRIFNPLRLTSTSLPSAQALPGTPSNGYQASGLTTTCGNAVGPKSQYDDVTTCYNPTSAWTAGAMVSSFGDLQTWLKALVSGSLLTPAMQAARTTWVQGDIEGIPIQYGLGIMQVQAVQGNAGTTFWGHAGEFWGYATVMMQGNTPQCQVQVLDLVNAMEGVEVHGAIPPSYAALFFGAGGMTCGGQTIGSAKKNVQTLRSKGTGPAFWGHEQN
ncbi:MAG TPA: serine hydrolase domain-containing protein [Thermoanaerobaculia bacterium]|nr:serine hydrolase domain-containing protein [Thermoanaerobaculia bacterium]